MTCSRTTGVNRGKWLRAKLMMLFNHLPEGPHVNETRHILYINAYTRGMRLHT